MSETETPPVVHIVKQLPVTRRQAVERAIDWARHADLQSTPAITGPVNYEAAAHAVQVARMWTAIAEMLSIPGVENE